MAYGLQLFRQNGSVAFDSTNATGGVCLGIYTNSSIGQTFDFPGYVGGYTGLYIPTGASVYASCTASMTGPGGCLRFTFNGWVGQTLALFVK
jgi:hypothetical protein